MSPGMAVSRSRIAVRSPAMPTSGRFNLPISAGSPSIWMIRARGAKVSTLPVARSSKRAPTQISRSHSSIAVLAARRAVHAEHAEEARRVGRQAAQALQGRDRGDAGARREGAQRPLGAGDGDAAAEIEDRRPRRLDQRVGARDRGGVGLGQIEDRQATRPRPGAVDRPGHVLGQVDQHRPRPARPGQREGLGEDRAECRPGSRTT